MRHVMNRIKGIIYTEDFCFKAGVVTLDGGSIASVELCAESDLTPEQRGQYILPGLVDIHLHGCAGCDFNEGTVDTMRRMALYELMHGITAICPATMTLPEERLMDICGVCAMAVETEKLAEGILLRDVLKGIYLEGPFISASKCGAQNPEHIRKPDIGMLIRLQQQAHGLIRIVAIAPEAEGALECIRRGNGDFLFSLAHTCADYATAAAAIREGARHITHLYNAMPPYLHREPGVIGAAADNADVTVELICDGVHVHPAVVRNTFRLFGAGRVVLVSDSMMAAGMEDGEYMLGDLPVSVRGGHAAFSDGTLAGSAVNLFDCMKKAVEMGVPVEDAVRAAACNPAKVAGLDRECGVIRAGGRADILVTDRRLNLQRVIKSGITVMERDTAGQ